ncbi:MAG: MMPL family transporter [Rhodothermaceae bacterium]|nr:MMPL family transporter [Rhodothermaceae bacterium]
MEPQNKFQEATVAFARWVIRWRWAVVIGSLIAAMGIGSGAQGLFFDTGYRAFFNEENPQLMAFESLQKIYTNNDNVLFVVAPKDGEVFDTEVLLAIEEIAAEAWKTPFALRVDAITNYQHTYAEEDDLIVQELVYEAASLPPSEFTAIKDIAVNEPFLRDRLIDPDARVTGVNVTLQLPGESPTEGPEASAFSRQLADEIQAKYPNVDIYLTGIAELNNAFVEISQNEMSRLLPLMFGLMILVMIISLRSVSGTIATMLVILFSVIVAMGFGGFLKIGLTPPSAQAPTIIMTLAIADSIHILVTMLREMRKGMGKYDAIVESIRVNMAPVFLTSVSTVIGFLTLNFSDVPPFNHLGNMTAVGVVGAFVFSVTFLPAFIAILPVKPRVIEEGKSTLMDRLADFVILRRKPLLWVTTATVVLFAAFIPLNVLEDRFVEYFDETTSFRQHTDFTADNLTGLYQAEFSLGAGSSGGISDPEYLMKVEEFALWLRAKPEVLHVNTFTDVMKRLNKNMHADDPSYYRVPDSRELAAQFLLLYEMSLPYGLDLNNQINVDKSATRLTVTLDNISSANMRRITEESQAWLTENAPAHMYSVGSGAAIMFSYVSGINISSMLQGSILALFVISFLMIFALRSLKLGLISFIPNLLPAVIAFGIWGIMSGVVNLGLSIVIGMTLGIVVDDSIHFLSKYRRAREEQGLNAEDAVRYAFNSVGRALVVTTVILSLGFLVLSTSVFLMNASMGLMTAITIVLALLIDFLMLPPLLIWLDGNKENKPQPAGTPANSGRSLF